MKAKLVHCWIFKAFFHTLMLKPMFMFVVKIVMLCNGQVGGDFVSHLLVIYVPFLHFFNVCVCFFFGHII
jgi:hypothetical protein